jgi:site-specific DNA recombinase
MRHPLRGMKKAVLYARVSSDLQQKERTIESQIAELKKQVVESGNVLVKEYIDDGYSGAQLDRPGMNQLRADLKMSLFDTIYFLNTDRIARDVTYKNIIIGEILKYKKQVIINGVDYIHNPENKFTLTVLGAVSELERAKIIERMTRGKMHRLNQGYLLGQGYNTFGYTYIKRTPEKPSEYVINESEAKIVRYIYETYAKGEIGINMLSRRLEEQGVPTREGRKLWNVTQIKYILKNESYAGIRYFHTRVHVKTNTRNPLHKLKYGKKVYRDRSEWIGIKIPAIISRALYDKVKAKLEYNRSCYRNPKRKQLLSNMLECGECQSRCYSYQRYYKKKHLNGDQKIFYKAAYKCNWQRTEIMHAKTSIERCRNPEISTKLLEPFVFEVINEILIDPVEIRNHMDFFRKKRRANQLKMEGQLKNIEEKIHSTSVKKKRLVDLYTSGNIERDEYAAKNLEYDNEVNALRLARVELLQRIPLLHKPEIVEVSIKEFCASAKAHIEQAGDFESKRQFLKDHITKVVYKSSQRETRVRLCGAIPVRLKEYEDPDQPTDASKIEFCIERTMNRLERATQLRYQEKEEGTLDGLKIPRMEYGRLMVIKIPELK